MQPLISLRAKSGYKYISFDKKNSKLPWFIIYKRKRGKSFDDPKKAAEYFIENYALVKSSNWWEKPTANKSSIDGTALFGIRIEMSFEVRTCVPKTPSKKLEVMRDNNIDCTNLKAAREIGRSFKAFLEDAVGVQSASLALLWDKFTTQVTCRKGTVIGYLPASEDHVILFDDEAEKARSVVHKSGQFGVSSYIVQPKLVYQNLLKKKDWQRIPWENNVLDPGDPTGERPATTSDIPQPFGPECPRCVASLGIGSSAWSRCSLCHLNEPGVLWSLRFTNIRNDANAWPSVNYEDCPENGND